MVVTKEQERQALQQIRKIVEDLGEDSYIGMAFEGVWEIAEENIENDYGKSCKFYIDRFRELKIKNSRIAEQLVEKEHRHFAEINGLTDELSKKESIISEQEIKIEEMERELENMCEARYDKANEITRLKEKLGFTHRENVELKAKLYDLMFKGD